MMATEPIQQLIPTVQAPQTTYGVLQHFAASTTPTGNMPGEKPMLELHMARSVALGKFTLSVDDAIGTEYLLFADSDSAFPTYNTQSWGPSNTSDISRRLELAPSWCFYFNQSLYYNAEVTLTFWAIKPPQAVGRLRFVYRPPINPSVVYNDPAQREVTKEWDLSASNLFEFKIPSYNLRNFRNTANNYAALNGLDAVYRCPPVDFKMGYVRIYNTHMYQPGSIFPNSCSIIGFMSFQNPQFRTVVGPAIPMERTVLSYTVTPS